MSIRASSWSITINNPNPSDEEDINRARQKGYKVEGQLEKGENGTPHYQLMVKTPQIRFSAMKKMFKRAHIEVARNPDALEAYVQKEDTRIGKLAETNEMYPSLSKLWLLFQEWSDQEIGVNTIHLTGDDMLHNFDRFVRVYIEKGYHIETMAVNPQIRSCVKNYILSIFQRCRMFRRDQKRASVDRQTDRQTDDELEDEKLSCDDNITDASSQSTSTSFETESTSSSR